MTTVEWNPVESSVFASGGEDDQISIWDLAAERDADMVEDENIKVRNRNVFFFLFNFYM